MLLQVVRNVQLYPLLRGLLNEEISKFNFEGTLPHFTYRRGGDEALVQQDELDAITAAIGAAVGIPRLRARPVRNSRGQGTTLVLPAAAKQACFMELPALAANLSAQDMATLPPPLDVQERALQEQSRQGAVV
jgi:hypothetical protein